MSRAVRGMLKTLVLKEVYNLQTVKPLFGNFISTLELANRTHRRFDSIISVGVLYHMVDPVKVLHLMSVLSDTILLWTHYYDAVSPGPTHFEAATSTLYGGISYATHCHQNGNKQEGFLGGNAPTACWLERKGIVAAMSTFGFEYEAMQTIPEEINHPHGPQITALFRRRRQPVAQP